MDYLNGKKTYIVAGLVGIVTGLHAAGLIDDTVFTAALGFLNAAGLGTLRAGVAKSGPTS